MPDNKNHWLGLHDSVVVITGAAGGIGRAIALSATEAGAAVALLDRDLVGCQELAHHLTGTSARCLPLSCDVSMPDSVAAAAEAVTQALGPPDVLVNNAGIARNGPLSTMSLEDWDALLAVDLRGYLICAQTFGRPMMERHAGSLVHMASIGAHHPRTNGGAYSVSKAGVSMLSRQLAAEWGPSGIRSNTVSPGMTRTPLSQSFYDMPGVTEKRIAIVPSRRIGTAQDVANVVLFLASARASYVNGADLTVDGGFECTLMTAIPRPGVD